MFLSVHYCTPGIVPQSTRLGHNWLHNSAQALEEVLEFRCCFKNGAVNRIASGISASLLRQKGTPVGPGNAETGCWLEIGAGSFTANLCQRFGTTGTTKRKNCNFWHFSQGAELQSRWLGGAAFPQRRDPAHPLQVPRCLQPARPSSTESDTMNTVEFA